MKKTLSTAQAMFIAEGTPVTENIPAPNMGNAPMFNLGAITTEETDATNETAPVKRTWHTDNDYIASLPEDVQAAIKALEALPATLQTTFISSLDAAHKLAANYAAWLVAPKAHTDEEIVKARSIVTGMQEKYDLACKAIAKLEQKLVDARTTRQAILDKATESASAFNTPAHSTRLNVVTHNDCLDVVVTSPLPVKETGKRNGGKRATTVKADGTERKARRTYVNSSTGQPLTVLATILKLDWHDAMIGVGKGSDGVTADVEIVNGEVTLTIVSSVGQTMGMFKVGEDYPLEEVLKAWRSTGNTPKAYVRALRLDGTALKAFYINAETKGITGLVEEGTAIGAAFPVPALTFGSVDAIDTWLGMES